MHTAIYSFFKTNNGTFFKAMEKNADFWKMLQIVARNERTKLIYLFYFKVGENLDVEVYDRNLISIRYL